jgi:hypothetical protein
MISASINRNVINIDIDIALECETKARREEYATVTRVGGITLQQALFRMQSTRSNLCGYDDWIVLLHCMFGHSV